MNNILLIGGTGFVGRYLAGTLSERPDNSVFVIHKSILAPENMITGVIYYRNDLAHKNTELEKVFLDKNIVVIMTQPDSTVIENIVYYLGIAKNLKKIIYTSSVLIYPSSSKAQDEASEPNPISSYENGKLYEEVQLSKFAHNAGIQLCIARLGNVYGDIKNRRIIGFIFDAALKNETLKINGDGEQKRDYIFIEDAINFLEFLMFFKQKKQKEIFNICTGKGYTINNIISEVEANVGRKIPRFHGPPILEKKEIIGDNYKILTVSDIKVKYGLSAGLKKVYDSYLKSLK